MLVGYEAFQYTLEEPHFGNVLHLDDLDGDGRDEFLVSHSLETFRRPASEVFMGGAVRVLRYRPDKDAREADTIDELRALLPARA